MRSAVGVGKMHRIAGVLRHTHVMRQMCLELNEIFMFSVQKGHTTLHGRLDGRTDGWMENSIFVISHRFVFILN